VLHGHRPSSGRRRAVVGFDRGLIVQTSSLTEDGLPVRKEASGFWKRLQSFTSCSREEEMRVPYRMMVATDEVRARVLASLETGISYGGEETQRFEAELAARSGRRYAVTTNSGTSAAMLALEAAGIGADTEVILPANGYVGALSSVIKLGATPVFADVEPETGNLLPKTAAGAVTVHTRALMPTHMYGLPCDMDGMIEVGRNAELFVLEDAAHALGAEYKGRPTGGLGDAGFFSFSGKMITVFGPGGALVTDNRRLAETVSSLRDQGRGRMEDISFVRRTDGAWYEQTVVGYNMHLTEMCAAAGRAQLRMLPAFVAHRRRAASYYTSRFSEADVPLRLPAEPSWAASAFLHYVVQTPERDRLRTFLREHDIETSIHYPVPLHLLAPVRERYGTREGQYPEAERLCRQTLSLPVGPHMTPVMQEYVADKVISFFRKEPSTLRL
jgi:dTDP-4-amino-4,6-dideoxygalactose transaminase